MREPLIRDGNRNVDLRSHLLDKDTIILDTDFNSEMASAIIQQLTYMDALPEKKEEPINILIFSPGGSIYAGLAILDKVKTLNREVHTIGTGLVASMGALFLTCGAKKGNRFMTRHCQVMFHQASAGTSGTISDMNVANAHQNYLNDVVHELIAEGTGQDLTHLKTILEKDVWLKGQEVLDFGAADHIIEWRK